MWNSNWGRSSAGTPKPDLLAPSQWLPAPVLPGSPIDEEARELFARRDSDDPAVEERIAYHKLLSPHYQHVDGTSMAAPIVTSLVAQMVEANPRLTPAAIKDIITNTAVPLAYVSRAEQGHGVINAAGAVAGALRANGGPLRGLPVSPHLTPGTVNFFTLAAGARSVALVADFNGWRPAAGQMLETRPGVWQISLPVPRAGEHTYKFVLDGERWRHDVENPARIEDGCGGYYSRLTVA